jgi:hypothetical protein
MPLTEAETLTLETYSNRFCDSLADQDTVQEELDNAKSAMFSALVCLLHATGAYPNAVRPKTYLDGIEWGETCLKGWIAGVISTLDVELLQAVAGDFVAERLRVESLVG